jgi:hypothetical protein
MTLDNIEYAHICKVIVLDSEFYFRIDLAVGRFKFTHISSEHHLSFYIVFRNEELDPGECSLYNDYATSWTTVI